MIETMVIKLALLLEEKPDIAPERAQPQSAPDLDEEIFLWESIFIDPEVDPDITIEGIPISEIAAEVQSFSNATPVLSYEDILMTFGLNEDVYTPEHHERLLLQALFGTHHQLWSLMPCQKRLVIVASFKKRISLHHWFVD